MFRAGYSIAREYTHPVVLSRKTVGGKCSSSIGAYVVVNDEGWIVTAFHIIKHFKRLEDEEEQAKAIRAEYQAIESDGSLSAKEKRKRFSRLKKSPKDTTERGSAWWGVDGVRLTKAIGVEAVDLAIAKLEPFDPNSVKTYPMFKDPAKDFQPGTSLCKLGFPFHAIEPVWNADKEVFELPEESLPMPVFPIDGILTRFVKFKPAEGDKSPPFPLHLIETSTPGLRGQSGGPVFDVQGTIWAIQTHTVHYPLGFDPQAPGQRKKEHQFLNVGRGVHSETIIGLMNAHGVRHQVSPY